ncbi:MAG: hypothetical protein D6746_16690 [Bacteroidetes bacterium]|nr:MAG: hypothetical protein D6746_16690 [Bacteroidota bacterium]
MKKLIIEPLPPKTRRIKRVYQVKDQFNNVVEEIERPGIKGIDVPDKVCYPVDFQRRMLRTGLLESISNEGFIYGMKPDQVKHEYQLDSSWDEPLKRLVKDKMIKIQHWIEIRAGVPYDYYTPFLPKDFKLFDTSVRRTPLMEVTYNLNDGANIIDTSTPMGYLIMDMLKHCGIVARSRDQVNPTRHRYVIRFEGEADDTRMRKLEVRDQAVYHIMSLRNGGKVVDLAYILDAITEDNGRCVYGGNTADASTVYEAAKKYVHAGHADKFMAAYNLYEDDRDRLIAQALINRGIHFGVIKYHEGEYLIPGYEHKRFKTHQGLMKFLLESKEAEDGGLYKYLMNEAGL